jgi:hypothetical protein
VHPYESDNDNISTMPRTVQYNTTQYTPTGSTVLHTQKAACRVFNSFELVVMILEKTPVDVTTRRVKIDSFITHTYINTSNKNIDKNK